MFGHLNVTSADFAFEGAYYFQGTRAFDPATFDAEGTLPLSQAIDGLWISLHTLVTVAGWRRLRADIEAGAGGYDGLPAPAEDAGAEAARRTLRHVEPPPSPRRSRRPPRLPATPEIVEDIARCSGLDLAQRFEAATTPSIAKFRTTGIDTGILHAGFWFIHGMLEAGEPGWLAQCDCNGYGKAVPPQDVVAIELVNETSGEGLNVPGAPERRTEHNWQTTG